MPYLQDLVARFWAYRAQRFAGDENVFDEPAPRGLRPPVFLKTSAIKNVLVDPSLRPEQVGIVHAMLPRWERHRWFQSMRSSQALVQSVFGNLRAMGLCNLLQPVQTDEGFQPFGAVTAQGPELTLERKLSTLGEPQPTSVDINVESSPHVAIECKLAEDKVGPCSRPGLGEEETDYCDGTYRQQLGRASRCALTELKIKYWEFVPQLFTWGAGEDHIPCPLRSTYQLVRNVLAASVTPQGAVTDGRAVLLYDARNPHFQPGGQGHEAYVVTKAALHEPCRLQRLTWQAVLKVLRQDHRLNWLTSEIDLKYGL